MSDDATAPGASEPVMPATGAPPVAHARDTSEPAAPLAEGGTSSLADGEWHRLHPLTPLFRGGIVLIVVIGVIFANLRDRLIYWAVSIFAPHEAVDVEFDNGDPVGFAIDWTLANDLVLLVGAGVLVVLALVCGAFWLTWRQHQFRITDESVEVKKGILFRSHRRAPLDRVQGVNLTRPFPARLAGMAKLEVDGAGTDANVPLEYLGTRRAEKIRSDILRLASGVRAAREAARTGQPVPQRDSVTGRVQATVSAGVQELIGGVDTQDVAPESAVKLPVGRVIGSQVLEAVWWIALFLIAVGVFIVAMLPNALRNEDGDGFVILGFASLFSFVPMLFAVFAILWAQVSKSMRYSIAPTSGGVRVTYGLLTTVTQTIPPGRIHALEISQPILWRPFGWWKIKVNRVSGQSQAQQNSGNQFTQMLPVGTREDVERVLQLCLPFLPDEDLPFVIDHGMYGPRDDAPDAYRTMARRGRWRRPFSYKRHGFAVTGYGLLLRRGAIWRKQAIFPLARMQGVSIAQGPIDRAQRIAWAQAHAVPGPISGQVVGLERDDALLLLEQAQRGAVAAAAADRAHRWGAAEGLSGSPVIETDPTATGDGDEIVSEGDRPHADDAHPLPGTAPSSPGAGSA